jgi:prepilin-type N-terminal cleavage/methylation domain-containing protein
MSGDSGLDSSRESRGFSLIEVMVAAVVAVIAVLGLAFSFSAGRGLIDRYAVARDALEACQSRLDSLAMEAVKDPAAADLTVGTHTRPGNITLNKNQTGTEQWTVVWVDDPVDGTAGADEDPNDYKRATVEIDWRQGSLQDHIRMSRSFLAP